MSEGVAETGDDRVALHVDEMALVALDNRSACQQERAQHTAIDLDVVALGERRGLHEIDEQRRRLAPAGKPTLATMAICQGTERSGLSVVGLERKNIGGQREHLTPVESLEGPLGHRKQLFGSEVGHRPLSPGLSSRAAVRPGASRMLAVHKYAPQRSYPAWPCPRT